jgi:hypothetical protein
MLDGFPVPQKFSFAKVTVPGLNGVKTLICRTSEAQVAVPPVGVTKHA